ncbi:hypothetical protein Sste5346_006045 [Sporothrix stenoceras]|uniref:Uncharacterized protein n=1 Tax=Sporothrix stenoceras TaxID=5173 RepID=A0ABR3Z146_9PEZI
MKAGCGIRIASRSGPLSTRQTWLNDDKDYKDDDMPAAAFRREPAGPHPVIQTDTTRRAQDYKIMAVIRAAAAAGDIFRGDLPDDDDDNNNSPRVPSDLTPPAPWPFALEAAVDTGVLDDAATDKWRAVLLRNMYKRLYTETGNDEEVKTGA